MKKIAKVRAPNGFMWKIIAHSSSPTYVVIALCFKGNRKKIGEVCLHKQEDGAFETHSDLNERHHGKGFGAKLYARAIQWCLENGHPVRSSGCTSTEAQRVWRGKTIRKFFKIKTNHSPYTNSFGKKIIDPDNDIWEALPKRTRR